MIVGDNFIEDNFKIIGLAKIDKVLEGDDKKIYPGIYPIVYFEEYSVQIAIVGEHDFEYVSRENFEWLKIEDHCEIRSM